MVVGNAAGIQTPDQWHSVGAAGPHWIPLCQCPESRPSKVKEKSCLFWGTTKPCSLLKQKSTCPCPLVVEFCVGPTVLEGKDGQWSILCFLSSRVLMIQGRLRGAKKKESMLRF